MGLCLICILKLRSWYIGFSISPWTGFRKPPIYIDWVAIYIDRVAKETSIYMEKNSIAMKIDIKGDKRNIPTLILVPSKRYYWCLDLVLPFMVPYIIDGNEQYRQPTAILPCMCETVRENEEKINAFIMILIKIDVTLHK